MQITCGPSAYQLILQHDPDYFSFFNFPVIYSPYI